MRFMTLLPMLAVLPVLSGLSACQATNGSSASAGTEAPAATATLIGNVAYLQRIALPQDAQLKVQIADVGRADAPAVVIAETEIAIAGRQVPIPFTLHYDPAKVSQRGSYAVSARITAADGTLLWTTDARVNLPRPGASLNLMLEQVRQ